MSEKVVAKVWLFASESNPKKEPYQTLLYTNGETSCNCRGWTQHVAADGSRSCRHTRLVDMNQADETAKSFKNYVQSAKPKAQQKASQNPVAEPAPVSSKRKIQWNTPLKG